MERKKFLRKGIIGTLAIATSPSLLQSCSEDKENSVLPSQPNPDKATTVTSPSDIVNNDSNNTAYSSEEIASCDRMPEETSGPFINKSPADVVRENIIGDRKGIPLKLVFQVKDSQNNCEPLAGVFVDLWHCDAHGNYSEYNNQLEGNFTQHHFLRGRQTSDENGFVSFVSIFPGWYPGRAPHLHLEVLKSSQESLLVTQTSFPESVSTEVYFSEHYVGTHDTTNNQDFAFAEGGDQNLPDSIEGNLEDGYVLKKEIVV